MLYDTYKASVCRESMYSSTFRLVPQRVDYKYECGKKTSTTEIQTNVVLRIGHELNHCVTITATSHLPAHLWHIHFTLAVALLQDWVTE